MSRTLPAGQRIDAWQIASALLRYPDERLVAALPAIRDAARDLSRQHQRGITQLVDWLAGLDELAWQQVYVETFDFNRRADLHLTYHAYGDKRQRGIVLLRLKRLYGVAGTTIVDEGAELPDHLPMLLELAALRPEDGREVLSQYRAPLELIRRTLTDRESPFRVVLDLVVATLPALRGDQADAVRRLMAAGPPEEAVGLEPYAPGDIMPQADVDDALLEVGIHA